MRLHLSVLFHTSAAMLGEHWRAGVWFWGLVMVSAAFTALWLDHHDKKHGHRAEME